MATRLYDALFNRGNHEVGSVNTSWAKPFTNGAIAQENIDNYTLVELGDYDTEGNVTCKQLTDAKKPSYLVTTYEEPQLMEGETYVDFYNAKGEICGLTILEKEVRFETSAYELNSGVSALKLGMVAHFNPSTKKFIVSDKASAHADFATAYNQFEVVTIDTDFGFNVGKSTIRLKVTK